ncbi:unnamed protein product [Mytilus edulis]|uniref:C2H2-type domain-containing protein n=1 Tax=Mytilus edulis TaxID=6550 RepID=A0A8S3T7I2_MYTED|nr:unnamed protein product [Mytilus edulis]
MQHPPVACNLCPLKFTHYGELGIHIRQAHSDDIITRFVEFTKRNFIKNIQLMETNTNSDSDWLNTSREQTGITSCEEVQCLEKDYRRVKEDYQCKDESRVKRECECMEESGKSFTKEINERIEQNGNEASNNENRLREPNLNGIIDKVPATSNKYTELQKMKSVHVNIEPLRYPQRRVCNDPPSSETCQHSKTSKQIKEIAQLTVHDEIRSTGHTEWTEAIHKLKRSFRQKRKRDKEAKFISDPESFSNWLTANLPVDGIICGCGRHLKTVKSITVHLHRKSRTALKNLKIFKKSIVYNP